MFTLEQYEDQAGAHLDLIPKAEIDREKVASIDLNLIASNPVPGSEASILPIHVTILDQNAQFFLILGIFLPLLTSKKKFPFLKALGLPNILFKSF